MAISPPLTDSSAELFSSSAKTAQQFSRGVQQSAEIAQQFSRDHQSVQRRSSVSSAEIISQFSRDHQSFSRDCPAVQQRSSVSQKRSSVSHQKFSASQERSSASSAADLELVGCLGKERKEKQIIISCEEESAYCLVVCAGHIDSAKRNEDTGGGECQGRVSGIWVWELVGICLA